MLQKTQGLVLRALKYGDTSLVVNIFTRLYGEQSYLVLGERSAKQKQQRAGQLQPGMLLDMVVYQKPLQGLQRIKEFQPAYLYQTLHEEIIKNSIALFSIEVLLRILPEHAPMPEVFDFSRDYLERLDELPVREVANYPVFFLVTVGRLMGFDIGGSYSEQTPYLH